MIAFPIQFLSKVLSVIQIMSANLPRGDPPLNMKQLSPPTTNSYNTSSKPIYYLDPNNHQEYLLIISVHESKTILTKYDIEKDSYEDLTELNELISGPFGYAVHQKTNKLYVINTGTMTLHEERWNVYVYDFKTAKWKIFSNVMKSSHYGGIWADQGEPKFYNINGEIYILYQDIFDIYNHDKFNPNNNELKMVYDASKLVGYKLKAAYLGDLKTFICITQTTRIWSLVMNKQYKIWSLDMNDNDEENVWNECKNMKVPDTVNDIEVIIPYNNILVCFCLSEGRSIWCFDVVENKWYKSPKHCHRISLENKCFIPTDGGRYCYYYNDYDRLDPEHFRIDLFETATEELQEKIRERLNVKNMKCSFGYCRRREVGSDMIIPDYLKKIVFRYFNVLPTSDNPLKCGKCNKVFPFEVDLLLHKTNDKC